MLESLEFLTEDERVELYLIPVWVCILIAGADNKVDKAEIRKAIRIAQEKKEKANKSVQEYYKNVSDKFEINLKGYLELLPSDEAKRTEFLIKRLEKVNYLFSKIEKDVAYQLYLSFREMASEIAHASGGIFGLLSVSHAESRYVDLKMITNPYENQS